MVSTWHERQRSSTIGPTGLPMVIFVVWQAARGRFERHRRIARWTFPIWLYVSITGVTIYFMLR